MIESELFVVERPRLPGSVGGFIQGAAHAARRIKAARHADEADGIKPVGILQNFRLYAFGFDSAGITVRLDGVSDGRNSVLSPAVFRQEARRFFGRQPGGQRALGRIFFNSDAIMQQNGGGKNL